jgi:hypothetical protein
MKRLVMMAACGAAAASMGGCVIVDADVHDHGWGEGEFGRVYGAEVNARDPEVSITVHSNGCTEKNDFNFVVRNTGQDEFDIGFRRERPDNCKALVIEGRRLTWTFAELGIPRNSSVYILNPVGR